jgi:ubiquinone/menaquinone biosynthesis C-methylase UbiE
MKAAYQRYDHGRVGRWSGGNPGNQRISKERFIDLEDLMNRAGVLPLAGKRVLDIGCSGGWVLASMQRYGAQPENLYGVDVREDSIRDAQCAHPGLHFSHTNGRTLEFPDASFDAILFFTVFSSMLDGALRQQVASEADRVLRPGGAILWYDMRYRSLTNPDTRPCGKRAVRDLFPGYRRFLRTTTLLPPLARNLGKLTGALYPVLNSLPPLRSHYVGVFVKP